MKQRIVDTRESTILEIVLLRGQMGFQFKILVVYPIFIVSVLMIIIGEFRGYFIVYQPNTHDGTYIYIRHLSL